MMKLLFNEANKYMEYSLYKKSPKIYVVKVSDGYSRAMLFMRAQEFYETPLNEFRGKPFCIFDFMNQYRFEMQSTFDSCKYTEHWAGFNVPSTSLEKCYAKDATRDNFKGFITPYDLMMYDIISKIREDQPKGKFYLIGVDSEESKTMSHELAHALYFTNKAYKAEMDSALAEIPEKIMLKLKTALLEIGYRDEVLMDEAQAFLSTGLYWTIPAKARGIKSHTKRFERIFKSYTSAKA